MQFLWQSEANPDSGIYFKTIDSYHTHIHISSTVTSTIQGHRTKHERNSDIFAGSCGLMDPSACAKQSKHDAAASTSRQRSQLPPPTPWGLHERRAKRSATPRSRKVRNATYRGNETHPNEHAAWGNKDFAHYATHKKSTRQTPSSHKHALAD